MDADSPVIFFDGVCLFCIQAVQFIINHDPKGNFKFSSLQSEYAKQHLSKFIDTTHLPYSILLLERHHVYQSSTAVLKISGRLTGGWKLFQYFIIIPKPIRDALYDILAKNRYRWFGQADQCMVPDISLRERFLD